MLDFFKTLIFILIVASIITNDFFFIFSNKRSISLELQILYNLSFFWTMK